MEEGTGTVQVSGSDRYGGYYDHDDNIVSVWDQIGGIVAALFKAAAGVGVLIGSDYLVAYVMFAMNKNPLIFNGVYTTVSSLLTIIVLFIFSRAEGYVFCKQKSDLIKFRKLDIKEGMTCVLIALAVLMIVTVYMLIARWISSYQALVNSEVQRYDESMEAYPIKNVYPKWDQLLYVFALTFLIPISEEFTFRGIVYGAINRRLNGAWAIAVSSAVFGMMHGISIHIGYALISGVIIGLAYYAYDSIVATIIIHGVFNFFGSAIFYLADFLGISRNSIPGMFTVELLATLPALALLFTEVGKRQKMNKGLIKDGINEQA